MKRIILSCLICCMVLCVFAQKPNNTGRYTVIVQEGYPISLSQYTYMHTGQCTFPSGFDNLFAFLHNNEPKFSRFTGKLIRKSSKRWTQVAAMPEME